MGYVNVIKNITWPFVLAMLFKHGVRIWMLDFNFQGLGLTVGLDLQILVLCSENTGHSKIRDSLLSFESINTKIPLSLQCDPG